MVGGGGVEDQLVKREVHCRRVVDADAHTALGVLEDCDVWAPGGGVLILNLVVDDIAKIIVTPMVHGSVPGFGLHLVLELIVCEVNRNNLKGNVEAGKKGRGP